MVDSANALSEAMGETALAESTIVTMSEREDINVSGGVIHVVPAWSWTVGLER
jgi:hypothetical protein